MSRPPVAELENLAKMASTEATKENLDLRRQRILEIRHSKIEEKRAKLQNLQKEMSDLNEDIPLSGVEIESDSVVVAVSSARKSARKQKDPAAAMQGRQERLQLVFSLASRTGRLTRLIFPASRTKAD